MTASIISWTVLRYSPVNDVIYRTDSIIWENVKKSRSKLEYSTGTRNRRLKMIRLVKYYDWVKNPRFLRY